MSVKGLLLGDIKLQAITVLASFVGENYFFRTQSL